MVKNNLGSRFNDLKRYIGSIMYEDDINNIDINIEDLVLERRHK